MTFDPITWPALLEHIMATRAEEPPPEDATGSANSSPPQSNEADRGYQFDFLNWFYWSIWWQQYSYNWAMYQQQSMMGYPNANLQTLAPENGNMGTEPSQTDIGTGVRPNQESGGTNGDQQQQQPQPHAWGHPQFNQQWNWNLPQFGAPFQFPGTRIGQIYLRMTVGYETFIAPFWRRCAAELIDTVLFSLLLKLYQPDIDLRVPEIVFKGSDVWIQMDDDEILDVKDVLTWFLISSIMERLFHAVLETVCLILFSCTPGKWVMGLRVWGCRTAHLTRTSPGYSVRVHPGGRLSPFLAFLRSLFKAAVSLFIPMVVFFFHLNSGRTKYDELFGSVVVDTYSLKRPIYTATSGAGGYGNQLNQYAAAGDLNNNMNMPAAAAAVNRPQFRVG